MKRRVTREDIIRTTRDLIIRDGIRAVRVDEIAQKLEISKRTLYELFSDKDTLVGECWDKIREEQEKKIAGYLFYQPGSALEQAQNLIREYIDALCMISCISLQELQQKVSYADSYEKNRRFWLDSFTEVLEHCIADNSVLPDVDIPARDRHSPGYRMARRKKAELLTFSRRRSDNRIYRKQKEERQRLNRCLSLFTFY